MCHLQRRSRSAVMPIAALACLLTVLGGPRNGRADWPTYMHDHGRSGRTGTELQLPLQLVWTYRVPPPRPAWPLPAKQNFWAKKFDLKARVTYDRANQVVSDGRRVYFGSSADDTVRCLSLETGELLWTYFAEGPVRLAPTLDEGKIFFGSDDGYVYCLQSESGDLLWKQRAAPTERRIPGNGRMISAWPVRSDVLVVNGRVRCTAGLFPKQGVYQVVLDAGTGKELARDQLNFSPQGYLAVKGNEIRISAGRAPEVVIDRDKRRGAAAAALTNSYKDFPFALIATPSLHIAGGQDGVAAFSSADAKQLWTAKVAGKAYSLAIAADRLLVGTDQGVVYCFAADQKADSKATLADSDDTTGFPYEDADQRTRFADRAQQLLNRYAHRPTSGTLSNAEDLKGYCLVLGNGGGQLAYELANQSRLQVVGRESDASKVRASRENLVRARQYGASVSVHHGTVEKLPYADNLFNLIVWDGESALEKPIGDPAEIYRVLRPGGVAIMGPLSGAKPRLEQVVGDWLKDRESSHWRIDNRLLIRTKQKLPGGGEWTHLYGNPANNACSGDGRVAGELQVQWFGEPGPRDMIDRHHRTVSPLSADGRLIIPGDNRIITVDAYNGAPLWNVEVPRSRRVGILRDAGSMALADDAIYVVAQDRCIALDVATGTPTAQFKLPPDDAAQKKHWGWIAVVGDYLYGSATIASASLSGHSRETIGGTYYDRRPIVTSTTLFCFDRHGKQLKWRYQAKSAIANPTITIGEDGLYCFEGTDSKTLTHKTGRVVLPELFRSGGVLVSLDRNTGRTNWRREVADLKQLEHNLYLCYDKGRLAAVGSRNHKPDASSRPRCWYDLHVFHAVDGAPIWSTTHDSGFGPGGSHGEQDQHPVIVGNRLYVIPFAHEIDTGKRVADWRFKRPGHGCGTFSASNAALFFRASNPTMCNLSDGAYSKITQVTRPGCWINMITAGGLLLIPEASSGCSCNFSLQASMAFAPRVPGGPE